jgi:hypothetical protein
MGDIFVIVRRQVGNTSRLYIQGQQVKVLDVFFRKI